MAAPAQPPEVCGSFLRIVSHVSTFNLPLKLAFACVVLACAAAHHTRLALAQQPNPVDRQVTNPMTDTPNVNPLTQEQPVRPRLPVKTTDTQPSTQWRTCAPTRQLLGPENARVVWDEGNVDARIGLYRLQADKVTRVRASNTASSPKGTSFSTGQQRITGTRAE